MPDLFDYAEKLAKSRAARDAAIERAEAGAVPEWSILMLDLVRLTCLEQQFFTSDEVFERLELAKGAPSTHDSRAFGPVMGHAKALRYCQPTGGFVPCTRKSRHASPLRVWKSLLWKA